MCGFGFRLFVDFDLFFGRQRIAGRSVHVGNDAAGSGVPVNRRFVAVVFDQFADLIEHRRRIDLVDSAVCHRRILIELGSFFDSALDAAGNAEHHSDHCFGFGEDVSRIHLLRGALEAVHTADPAEISPGGKSRFLHHFTGQHETIPPDSSMCLALLNTVLQ